MTVCDKCGQDHSKVHDRAVHHDEYLAHGFWRDHCRRPSLCARIDEPPSPPALVQTMHMCSCEFCPKWGRTDGLVDEVCSA